MELNKHICTHLVENEKAFTQVTLDDDFIVRDNKPDVVRVIYSKGDVYLEDIKTGNQVVWVTGKLRFSTLYLSDDEEHRLESVSGEIPFQEKIVMDKIKDRDEVWLDVSIEDLSVGIINSRKLVIRAVLNVCVKNLEEEVVDFLAPIDDVGMEQKTRDVTMLCLVDNTRDIVHMQKEMLLPNSRGNIGEIIFYQVDFHNEEVSLQSDKVSVEMDAQVWVLYRNETNGEYECFETIVPLNGEMECSALCGDEIFWSKISVLELGIEPRGDYDGEARMLGLDASISVELQIYREETKEILEDAYALDRELVMERSNVPFYQLLVKNISKIRLMEQCRLEPNQERILQICGSSGIITIDRVQKKENGILVEGVLSVHVLYNTTEDGVPYAHAESQLFIEQFVEIEGLTEESILWIDNRIEQLQVNLLDNAEYEVKALLQIGVFAMRKDFIENITSLEELPLDMDSLQKQPGIIGCVRKEGEELWDIAKKYHATAENIIEIGGKVLVVKQVR